METDHREMPLGLKQPPGLGERLLQFVELSINKDPDRLEGSRCRMLLRVAAASRHRLRDEIGQMPRRRDRILLPFLSDCLRDAAGETLFAVPGRSPG